MINAKDQHITPHDMLFQYHGGSFRVIMKQSDINRKGNIMADTDGLKVAKDYHVDIPFANQEGFFVKGANSLDWA